MKIKNPFLQYYGSKWKIAPRIINEFPAHRTFVDVFGGSASIILRKPPSRNEIYNDLHDEVINLFYCLRHHFYELERALKYTPYSRQEYKLSLMPTLDVVERARRTVVKSWFGIGNSLDRSSGFRVSINQNGQLLNPWLTFVDSLHFYQRRMRSVVIEKLDYSEILKKYDMADTLFYFDPPYVKGTRTHKYSYLHDWSDGDHRLFLEKISSLAAKFVLSGYENEIYKDLSYKQVRFMATTQAKAREEILWIKE